ncbi:MAG: MotA/TolQ/ExbB proton channel family protein [Verrucomicrobiae bacterium]|nr:MotA/TolQ/ExbB proton channel family protein [Verrucomicrobiae bacterium]
MIPCSLLALAVGQGDGFIFAIRESNVAGKIILIILFIGSLISWSVIISKWYQLHQAKNKNAQFLQALRSDRNPLHLYLKKIYFLRSPLYALYATGCKELLYHMQYTDRSPDPPGPHPFIPRKITSTAMSAVRSALEREVGEQALQLESQMVALAIAVSGAPFLGLLGTVWGVMDTFSSIALAGKAHLAMMAPGVSGALVTTVTGLMVAIPAMFGYNYLVVTVRAHTVQLDNFAAELISIFEHYYLDTRH